PCVVVQGGQRFGLGQEDQIIAKGRLRSRLCRGHPQHRAVLDIVGSESMTLDWEVPTDAVECRRRFQRIVEREIPRQRHGEETYGLARRRLCERPWRREHDEGKRTTTSCGP